MTTKTTKIALLATVMVLAISISASPLAFADKKDNGNPFQVVWDVIEDLQSQIDNIQLTPGPQGETGDTGAAGETGAQGIQGLPGSDGLNGQDGTNGSDGTNGINGIDGDQGIPGQDGAVGPQGEQGEPGDDGSVAELSFYARDRQTTLLQNQIHTYDVFCYNGDQLISTGYKISPPITDETEFNMVSDFTRFDIQHQSWFPQMYYGGTVDRTIEVSLLCLDLTP